MKKYTALIVLLITSAFILKGQEVITLNNCYKDALANHPLSQEKQMHHQLWQLKDENLATSWYPVVDAGANLLYNSNVTDLGSAFESVPIPGLSDNIPSMPHDQYRLTLDINQILYDGGASKSGRKIELASLQLNEQEVEVELYKIREQVNSSYFSFILLKKQKELLAVYQNLIFEQLNSIESAIQNGLLLPSDKDVLRAEKVRLQQQIAETEIKINTSALILSDLTGKEINHDSEALLPDIQISNDPELNRPELMIFNLNSERLEAGRDLIKSSRKPKAFAFATLGYGKPAGNDFFSDSFGPYYVLGAGMKWNIIDWKKSSRQEKMIDINKNLIDSRKSDLEDNLSRSLNLKQAQIRTYEQALISDEELIIISQTITQTAASKFKNGTITATDYLRDLNNEKQVFLNHEIHRISLVKSKIEYLNISGKEIE